MSTPSLRLRAFIAAAGIAILASAGWAAADPPSRVARLGYLSGAVSFSPAGEDDWMQAAINRPVTTGDRLWVDSGGAGRAAGRRRRRAHERRHRRLHPQPRRPHRPAAAHAGLAEHPRAPPRAEPGLRGRHAQPRLHRAQARRLPDRGRPRRRGDHHPGAQRPGRGLRRGHGLRRRLAPALSLHGDRPARRRIPRHAALRRFRPLVGRPRPRLRQLGFRPLCFAGRDRLPGSRRERHLARRRDLRQRLVPEPRGLRLGALPRRPLVLDRPVGLDLGG